MDQLRGAINSFTGGNNEQQTAQGTSGGGNFQGGLGSSQYSQQTPQGSSGRGNYAGGSAGGLGSNEHPQQAAQSTTGGGGFLGGLGNKLNAAAGGGQQSEKNEDYLDKGVDFVQEKFLGQGPQNNESAVEQMKDEQISDFIRKQYKSTTGSDFPIKDKS